MKLKIVTKTVSGTPEEDETTIVIETNSIVRAGAFIRDKVWAFNEREPNDIVDRVVSIEKDGVVEVLDEKDWDVKAIKWLEANDWY